MRCTRGRSRRCGGPRSDAGVPVVVVTGRMVKSVRQALEPAGLDAPVIAYQGAVVADEDGRWLRHEPIPVELAREMLEVLAVEGHSPERLRRRRALRRHRHRGGARVRDPEQDPLPRRRRPPRLARRAAHEARLRGRARCARRARAEDEGALRRPRVRRRSRCRTSSSSRRPASRRAPGWTSSPSTSGSRRRTRSRSATARTTSSSSSGPTTGSRSRTRTSASRPSHAGSARPPTDEGVAQVLEALLDSKS